MSRVAAVLACLAVLGGPPARAETSTVENVGIDWEDCLRLMELMAEDHKRQGDRRPAVTGSLNVRTVTFETDAAMVILTCDRDRSPTVFTQQVSPF